MVEQMVSSNLSKYGLGKCASILNSSDKQPVPVVAIKNTTVREVQNDNKHGPSRPFEQKEESVSLAKSPPGSSSNVNRNLVYARRKSDAEFSNSRASEKNRTSEQVGDRKHSPQMEAKIKANDGVQSFPCIPEIRNCENEQSALAMEHWNARFLQLQKYLKQCDSSNQEVYLQKLRSFSPDECSRHAVELERRAIQLMLEEGREIQRVQDLNILGKSAGNHLLLQPLTPIFKLEKLV